MIGYGSITLVGMEIRYNKSKLDYLALKWAVYGYTKHSSTGYSTHCLLVEYNQFFSKDMT